MIIVWGFIAFWTLVDPGFYQRCYASKDDKIPKKGILISIAFWMMFDVCTTFIGLYARAAMPNIDPVTSLAVFSASVLPVGLIGLFFAGLLATIMSTVDSFLFLGAMNISHDIYHKTINPNASDEKVIFVTKIAIVFTALASMIMAIYFNSLVSMWYSIGTIGISAMLVPLLAGFFYKGRKSELAALASMSLGALTSFIWLVNGWLNNIDGWAQYLFGIEPMYSGLFVSFAAFAIITLIENRFGNSRIGEKINFGVGT
jgi:SSS family solute:Na+ symporter